MKVPILPIEIWWSIFELSDRKTLLILMHVNRVARLIAEKLFYRIISFKCGMTQQIITLCRTISRRPSAALSVRSLDIFLDGSRSCAGFLLGGLIFMDRLQALTCRHRDGFVDSSWMFEDLSFRLELFSTDCCDESALRTFLQHQCDIVKLILSNESLRLPIPSTTLARLSDLEACAEVASTLVPGRPVRRVVLMGDIANMDMTLDHLRLSLCPVEVLGLYAKDWNGWSANSVARNLPSLCELFISTETDRLGEAQIRDIADSLSPLKQLSRLTLQTQDRAEPLNLPDLHVEHRWITSHLHRVCPSLRSVTLSCYRPYMAPRGVELWSCSPFLNEWVNAGDGKWGPGRLNWAMWNMWSSHVGESAGGFRNPSWYMLM